jgi:ATP-dependent DNA helicase RecG
MSEHEQSLRSAMQPVYPSTETLTNRGISNRVINKLMQQLFMETQALFTETLPDYLMQELQLIPKKAALFNIHFPKAQKLWRKPIPIKICEELFFISYNSPKICSKTQNKGTSFFSVGDNFDFYQNHLPLNSPEHKKGNQRNQNRHGKQCPNESFIAGDVGSGKNIAFMSMLLALDNGFQAFAVTNRNLQISILGLSELAKS